MTKPWCTCAFDKQDGYTHDLTTGLWVHAKCHKPSYGVFKDVVSKMSDEELEKLYDT